MNQFLCLISSAEFIARLKKFSPVGIVETLPLETLAGRVLAEDIDAPENMPPFHRSCMDGYAVRAKDTFGVSETEPFPFTVQGEVTMGSDALLEKIAPGAVARIWTGGELPPDADAVVMEEYTRVVDAGSIEVFRPVAPYENVVLRGEDIHQGQCLFQAGKRLNAYDTGILAGLGLTGIPVRKKPRVAIISSGDEIVPKETHDLPRGKIRDINTTTLSNMLRMFQCEPLIMGIVPDRFESIRDLCVASLQQSADMIVVSGGSSIGMRDLTLKVFSSLEGAEILAHGVEIRPGKPTILGRIGAVPLVGLPGHITSALVVFQVFIRVLLGVLSGVRTPEDDFLRRCHAVMSRNIPSVTGREDYVRVKLTPPTNDASADDATGRLPVASPVFGKSGTIQSLIQSDGLVQIGRDVEGLYAGQIMEVMSLA
ncbi:MAG: hypothetical protein BWK76_08710 [Desulfobulbaceae bacterium A2]|nr:MAG: hypothetical protein BWK76_08710 [Desulfobulbaceae bacterium A2]